jgi:hypothetical protein
LGPGMWLTSEVDGMVVVPDFPSSAARLSKLGNPGRYFSGVEGTADRIAKLAEQIGLSRVVGGGAATVILIVAGFACDECRRGQQELRGANLSSWLTKSEAPPDR